jgi:hypothetical protein
MSTKKKLAHTKKPAKVKRRPDPEDAKDLSEFITIENHRRTSAMLKKIEAGNERRAKRKVSAVKK